MTDVTKQQPLDIQSADRTLRAIAQEVACDSFDLEVILNTHRITIEQFRRLERTPRFQNYLKEAIAKWNSTENTGQRSEYKAGLSVEELIPTMHAAACDKANPLASRVEVFKALMKAGRIGEKATGAGGDSEERISVTINLGGSSDLKVEKTLLPTKVIDAVANDAD